MESLHSDISSICFPISGPYMIFIGCTLTGHFGAMMLNGGKEESLEEREAKRKSDDPPAIRKSKNRKPERLDG